MLDDFRVRRLLWLAIGHLEDVEAVAQQRGEYGVYGDVMSCRKQLQHWLRMLELDRARELSERPVQTSLDLSSGPASQVDDEGSDQGERNGRADVEHDRI